MLLSYYDEVLKEKDQPAPSGCLTIAIEGKLIPEVYMMVSGLPKGKIYWGEGPENWGAMAESLCNRLLHSAFLYYKMRSPKPVFGCTRGYWATTKTGRVSGTVTTN